jgi:hypothetical protein
MLACLLESDTYISNVCVTSDNCYAISSSCSRNILFKYSDLNISETIQVTLQMIAHLSNFCKHAPPPTHTHARTMTSH